MKNYSWIKMGFKILKVIMLTGLVVLLSANVSNKLTFTEKFEFVEIVDMSASATKKEEEKPVQKLSSGTVLGSYKIKGDLTGYSADCPACYGTLACKPSYKVYKNGVVTYPDKEYGNVRIVATHQKNLKCGSIIKFNLSTISKEPVYAIVLDRGVLGTDVDLLVENASVAYNKVGRRKITYEVVRIGY
ncbi:MAG: hypothetical protein E7171_01300 [Firmicutes bacterium]|nr:hypothetical protein [Bacillota bacterium]